MMAISCTWYTDGYKGYFGGYDWSDEYGMYNGRVMYIRDLITFEAEDLGDIHKVFQDAVDNYLQTCLDNSQTPNPPADINLRPIATAPKDGTLFHVLRPGDMKPYEVKWDAENGTWEATVGGWFEPGEVHYWLPIE